MSSQNSCDAGYQSAGVDVDVDAIFISVIDCYLYPRPESNS
jgi:hypothetical protein